MSNTLLRFDGDTDEIRGHEYTVRTLPDEDMSIMDEQGEGMWCGRLEWTRNDSTTGYGVKPDGFVNGRTVKLDTDRHDTLWWEIPVDMRSWKAGGFADEATWRESLNGLRSAIKDILNYGYIGIEVTSDDGFSAALWGIECFPDADYYSSVALDCVADIEAQRDQATEAGIRRILDQVGLAGFPI